MGIFNLLGKGSPETKMQIQKDPFKQSCITGVSINYSVGFLSGRKYWYGTVKFENGKTKGEQDFEVDGIDGFSEITQNIQTFIKSLD